MVSAGDAWAASVLSRYYLDGVFFDRDEKLARSLAERGLGSTAQADALFATFLADGVGGKRDTQRAGDLLSAAVKRPDVTPDVHYAYGMWLLHHQTALPNHDRWALAKEQAILAADSGFTPALSLLGDLAIAAIPTIDRRLTKQIAAAKKAAANYYLQASLRSNSIADFKSFLRWSSQDGSPETIEVLVKLARAGSRLSQGELAYRYFHGGSIAGKRFTPPNVPLAKQYAELAARQGDGKGMHILGLMYLDGHLPRDVPKGISLLEAAGREGELEAYADLYKIYNDGHLPRDPDRARYWAEKGLEAAKRRPETAHEETRFSWLIADHDKKEKQKESARQAYLNSAEFKWNSLVAGFLAIHFLAGMSGVDTNYSHLDGLQKSIQDDIDLRNNVRDIEEGKYNVY